MREMVGKAALFIKVTRRRAIALTAAVNSPEAQRLIVLSLLVLFVISVSDKSVFAQAAQDGGAVTTTLQNLINTIYFQWRIPISILGLFAAVLALFSSSPHGRAWALKIFIAVVIWALIPTFISLISGWTGTNGNGNINGGGGGI
ncbi:MAG: hypothetical protein ACREDR_36440 [Blastocatellia bacterium]